MPRRSRMPASSIAALREYCGCSSRMQSTTSVPEKLPGHESVQYVYTSPDAHLLRKVLRRPVIVRVWRSVTGSA